MHCYSLHAEALKLHVAPWSGEQASEKPLPAVLTAPSLLTTVGKGAAAGQANSEGLVRV